MGLGQGPFLGRTGDLLETWVWIQASEWLMMGVVRVRIKQPQLCGKVIVKGLLRGICWIYLLPGFSSLKLPE